jgi:hypothetical protein
MVVRLGAVLLSVFMVSAVPLASALPTDPTWIGGVYDGADGDAIVLSACANAIREPEPPCPLAARSPVETVPVREIVRAVAGPWLLPSGRAPPAPIV